MFEVAAGLLISRIVASLIGDSLSDTMLDLVFTVLMQVGFLLIGPFLIYKFALKKSTLGVLELSNVRKPDWRVMLLCIPLGVLCLLVTMGISTIWQVFLILLGYTPSGGSNPETFSVWILLLNIFLTGVLPGVCEEFANRGGFLTAMRGSFNPAQTVLLCGLAFGLFHQNITQIFYTFCFGMLMAWLVLRTKSIFPGVLVHFLNNSISVYLDFASDYNLPLGGFFDSVNNLLVNNFIIAVFLWALCVAAAAGLVFAIYRLTGGKWRSRAEKNAAIYGTVGYNSTANQNQSGEGIVITEAEDEKIQPEENEKPLEDKMLYKPVLRDWAFYIGALVMTAVTTVLTFVWGL